MIFALGGMFVIIGMVNGSVGLCLLGVALLLLDNPVSW